MADYPLLPPLQTKDPGQGRRMLLAFAACLGVILLSNQFMPKPPPPPPAAPAPPPPAAPPASPVPPAPPAAEPPAETAQLRGGDLEAEVTNAGAGITWLTCLRNPDASVLYDSPLCTAVSGVPPLLSVAASDLAVTWRTRWRLASRDGASARFETTLPGGVRLSKTLRLPRCGHEILVELEALNPGSSPAALPLEVLLPPLAGEPGMPLAQTARVEALLLRANGDCVLKYQDAAAVVKKGAWRPEDPGRLRWAGMVGGYFVALASLEGGDFAAMEARPLWHDPAAAADDDRRDPFLDHAVVALSLGTWTLAPGEARTATLRCYAGPKKASALAAADPLLPQVLERGMIATPIMATLQLLHGLAGNYGLAIILLTLLVRSVIHPLNRMAQVSMMTSAEKMKRLQPRLDEIKKRHKGNSRKLMEEQTRVMKEEGMSPLSTLGGCLPILLQMPVLFALYNVLQGAIELRGAPFLLWVHDLARPDTVFTLHGVPFLGNWNCNPLPIVLIGVTVYQMWRAPKPADPQMAQQQKMMLFIMPVMFGFMFYSLPAGITLYWVTSTTFSIAEQWYIRRLLIARGVIPATGR